MIPVTCRAETFTEAPEARCGASQCGSGAPEPLAEVPHYRLYTVRDSRYRTRDRSMAKADSKGTDMPRPIINEDDCSGCGVCVDTCPSGVIELVGEVARALNEDDCTGCEACLEECPMGAITEVEED